MTFTRSLTIVSASLFSILLFTNQQCSNEENFKNLNQRWVHSYEEDSVGVEAFRPQEFNFPPSRGRKGMEFKADGQFIRYDIAPTDGNVAVTGNWVPAKGKNRVQINLTDAKKSSYTLEIVSLTDELLKVKKAKDK
jgi:hypothetical protein